MATSTSARLLELRNSAVARLVALELAVAIVFIGSLAMFAGNQLDFQDVRRNRQLVTREIGRLTDLGDPSQAREALTAMAKADHRITPDIVYALIPNLADCVERRLDTIAQCADLKLWTKDIEDKKLNLSLVLRRMPKPTSKQDDDGPPKMATLQPDVEFTTEKFYYKARRVGSDALLLIGIDRSVIFAEREALLIGFVAAVLLYVLVAIVVARWFMMHMTRRITEMTDALERVAAGQVKERINLVGRNDEINTL